MQHLCCASTRFVHLLQDEEDEELLNRAKANRAKRLAEDRAVQRSFIQVGMHGSQAHDCSTGRLLTYMPTQSQRENICGMPFDLMP